MNVKASVIRGAFSLGGARAFVSALNAVGILVLARLLTPADFGIVAIVTAILSVVVSLTEASLQPALVQCREPTPDYVDTVWTMSMIRAVLIFCIFLVVSWPLAQAYGDPRLMPVLIVSGVTAAFTDFVNPLLTLATREMRFRPMMLFQIFQKFIGVALAIGLALWFQSFWAIIIGNAIGAVLAALGSYLLIPYRPRLTMSRAREVWGFSGWMFLNQLCETFNWRFDQLVIGLTVTKAALGSYSIADSLAVIPTRELSVPLRNALLAGLANLGEHRERICNSFIKAQSTVAMVTAPAAVGLALVADPAVRVLLGEKWLASIPFVRILAITYALDTFITVVRPLGMAMGETKYLFWRQFVALFIRIPLILAGLLLGGLIGAALGRAISGVLNSLISFLVVERLLDLSVWRQLKSHGLTAAGLVVMSGTVLFAETWFSTHWPSHPIIELAVLGPLGAFAYCGAIFAIWMAHGRGEGPVAELIAIIGNLSGLLTRRRVSQS